MKFEWNEVKRQEVLNERGVDFAEVALMFKNPTIDRPDLRGEYPEDRTISLGVIGDQAYIVVHCAGKDDRATIRIITAWKGGKKRYEQYQKLYARGIGSDESEG